VEKGTTRGTGTYVGLDVHKAGISVALLREGESKSECWQIQNDERSLRKLAKKLLMESAGDVVCCYEAGPCGYAVQRWLASHGVCCEVVAPALIPVKPGERVKTDRRDARKLAELLRACLLTTVRPPTLPEEAVRELCRTRESEKQERRRWQQRITSLLLRRGIRWDGVSSWTVKHQSWLRALRLAQAADQIVLDHYLLALEQVQARISALEVSLQEFAEQEPYRGPVGWLRCFRGVNTVTAMTVLSELHDLRRFTSPRDLMGYLGLTPSEYSSSDRTRRGKITKAGNGHVRRILVESAWHYRHPAKVTAPLRARRAGQPTQVIAIADKAQTRLSRRYWRLVNRGKPHAKAIVAVARELVGFLWAALQAGQALSQTRKAA
jgi:transposase